MAHELKVSHDHEESKELDNKYNNDEDDYDNQEVIVNDRDLRIKVLKSVDRKENIMECIGHLETDYIYDSNGGYRKSTAGTGTVFYVNDKGETFVITCAHNIRTLVWKCETCNIYMDKKSIHGKCDINDLKQIIIKANEIRFIKRCNANRKEIQVDKKEKEIFEYGEVENAFECDVDNIFINDKMYSLYPSGSSGYDLCVLKFQKK
eukprot:185612_1